MAKIAYKPTPKGVEKTARIMQFCQTELNKEASELQAELTDKIIAVYGMGRKSAEELAAILIYKTGGDVLDWVKTW